MPSVGGLFVEERLRMAMFIALSVSNEAVVLPAKRLV
jgi:hypothetical protein